uniref:Putative secreted protein n=1 Tax=Anopheles triannulatus TaxID=58253 RepID=A0A2M4B4D4_9DIPT
MRSLSPQNAPQLPGTLLLVVSACSASLLRACASKRLTSCCWWHCRSLTILPPALSSTAANCALTVVRSGMLAYATSSCLLSRRPSTIPASRTSWGVFFSTLSS